MKNLFNNIIFISVLFSFLYTGCENADLQKSTVLDDKRLTERYVDACNECPNEEDCCGRILFVSGPPITFYTCGTTDGDAAACSDAVTGCMTIDGVKNSEIIFEDGYLLLCMEENHSFYLRVTDFTNTVVLNITFQLGQISPQSINVTISGPGTYAFTVDDDCVVSQCYP